MFVVRCRSEIKIDNDWVNRKMMLWDLGDGSFKVREVEFIENDTEDDFHYENNRKFTREELEHYLDSLYKSRFDTEFVSACYEYLNYLDNNK